MEILVFPEIVFTGGSWEVFCLPLVRNEPPKKLHLFISNFLLHKFFFFFFGKLLSKIDVAMFQVSSTPRPPAGNNPGFNIGNFKEEKTTFFFFSIWSFIAWNMSQYYLNTISKAFPYCDVGFVLKCIIFYQKFFCC